MDQLVSSEDIINFEENYPNLFGHMLANEQRETTGEMPERLAELDDMLDTNGHEVEGHTSDLSDPYLSVFIRQGEDQKSWERQPTHFKTGRTYGLKTTTRYISRPRKGDIGYTEEHRLRMEAAWKIMGIQERLRKLISSCRDEAGAYLFDVDQNLHTCETAMGDIGRLAQEVADQVGIIKPFLINLGTPTAPHENPVTLNPKK